MKDVIKPGAKILIVSAKGDERSALCRFLRSRGVMVVVTKGYDEAMNAMQADPKIVLAICDANLGISDFCIGCGKYVLNACENTECKFKQPHTGIDLVRQIRFLYPQTKVLLLADEQPSKSMHVVTKPVTGTSLQDAIRALFSNGGGHEDS